MFRILGSPRRLCSGLTRRDWLHVGGLGALGLGLSDLFRLQDPQAQAAVANTFGKAKSCILLFPYGSPPQHETFDPKPEAPVEIRGEMGAISTSVPGVGVGDHLPKVAKIIDRLTIIRSMTHPFPVHGVAYATTGIPNYDPRLEVNPRDPQHWPYVGSCVDYVLKHRSPQVQPGVPYNMVLPWKMNSKNGGIATAGPYAAFLGPAYDPVVTDFEGEATHVVKKIHPAGGPEHDVRDPFAGVKPDCRFRIDGARLQQEVTLDRLNRRRSLAEQFDQARSRIDANRQIEGFDRFREMAYRVLTGTKMRDALDVRREPIEQRERYGMTLFGQACLAARRLIEAGGKFVTVFWDEVGPINTDWDTHWNHYHRLKSRLLPGFDTAFSALILDLEARGMLDETLVIWMSEHGRTPKINNAKGGGRDHWSRAYSIALAGGGVAKGNVVGKSDRNAADVVHTPISPKDILATTFHLLGIDPHTTVPDLLQQQLPIAGQGRVRTELF